MAGRRHDRDATHAIVARMEAVLGLIGYTFVAAVTPGPNNVVLWGIGLRFGFRAAIPYLLGIPLGVGAMVLAVAAGVGVLISTVPVLDIGLKAVGSAYLLYLAWQVAGSAVVSETDVGSAPGFGQSVAFQFVNPKAWFFVLSAVAAFRPASLDVLSGSVLMAVVVAVVVLPSGVGVGRGRARPEPLRERAADTPGGQRGAGRAPGRDGGPDLAVTA